MKLKFPEEFVNLMMKWSSSGDLSLSIWYKRAFFSSYTQIIAWRGGENGEIIINLIICFNASTKQFYEQSSFFLGGRRFTISLFIREHATKEVTTGKPSGYEEVSENIFIFAQLKQKKNEIKEVRVSRFPLNDDELKAGKFIS